jgi:hypothetical protein
MFGRQVEYRLLTIRKPSRHAISYRFYCFGRPPFAACAIGHFRSRLAASATLLGDRYPQRNRFVNVRL